MSMTPIGRRKYGGLWEALKNSPTGSIEVTCPPEQQWHLRNELKKIKHYDVEFRLKSAAEGSKYKTVIKVSPTDPSKLLIRLALYQFGDNDL